MFVLTEVVLQRAIKDGITNICNNLNTVDEIFLQYTDPKLEYIYGEKYINSIKDWLTQEKIAVVQAWSFDVTKIPCISIHLGSETDDETKASIGDYWGTDDAYDINVNTMSVMLDIGIHADKSKDQVLWLYYIVNYILYKEKPELRRLGLQLTTFNASEYNKESKYMTENIWTRWIRFKCTVQNYINFAPIEEVDNIETSVILSSENNPVEVSY